MSDQLTVLRIVAERLDGAGIPYMITGSTAMNFYAEPRMTRDIDLVAEIDARDAARIHALFNKDFYADRDDIGDAARERGSFNIIHNESLVKVDVLVRKNEPYRKVEFERRRTQGVSGFSIQVVSPEDLILSKLAWGKDGDSSMQLEDAKNVVESVKNLDWDYLLSWAPRLGVLDALTGIKP